MGVDMNKDDYEEGCKKKCHIPGWLLPKDEDSIPFLGGRPPRDTIIGVDEILNLRIALYATDSVKSFLMVIV